MSRRRLLVPEARAALEKIKLSALRDLSRPTPEDEGGLDGSGRAGADGGAMTTREAGEAGGPVGGEMVRRLVDLAREELERRNARP